MAPMTKISKNAIEKWFEGYFQKETFWQNLFLVWCVQCWQENQNSFHHGKKVESIYKTDDDETLEKNSHLTHQIHIHTILSFVNKDHSDELKASAKICKKKKIAMKTS